MTVIKCQNNSFLRTERKSLLHPSTTINEITDDKISSPVYPVYLQI